MAMICGLILHVLIYQIKMFTHLNLCLATANHNFKRVNITDICLIWDQTVALLFKHEFHSQ